MASASPTLDRLLQNQARKVFVSPDEVELYKVHNNKKDCLVRHTPLEILSSPVNVQYPMFDGTAKVGNVQWKLKHEAHSMRTVSKKGEPTYIFSGVDEKDPEAFYAVILKKGTPEDTLTHLEQILGKLTAFHVSKTEKDPGHPLDNFFPDATEVVGAVQKGVAGLMSAVLGGGGGNKQQPAPQQQAPPPQPQQQQQPSAPDIRMAPPMVATSTPHVMNYDAHQHVDQTYKPMDQTYRPVDQTFQQHMDQTFKPKVDPAADKLQKLRAEAEQARLEWEKAEKEHQQALADAEQQNIMQARREAAQQNRPNWQKALGSLFNPGNLPAYHAPGADL
eukprot:jgi/Chrzof1/11120/Cz05g24150.t1